MIMAARAGYALFNRDCSATGIPEPGNQATPPGPRPCPCFIHIDIHLMPVFSDRHTRPPHKGAALQPQTGGKVEFELATNGNRPQHLCPGYDTPHPAPTLPRSVPYEGGGRGGGAGFAGGETPGSAGREQAHKRPAARIAQPVISAESPAAAARVSTQ